VASRLRKLGVSDAAVHALLGGNALRLLTWYTPPPAPESPKHYIKCTWCGEPFEPIEGQYFHKFEHVYCGTKCLRGHRDNGYKGVKAGSSD
jgi:DNA-directed RNA polymerase subunit RPC12/RpoP